MKKSYILITCVCLAVYQAAMGSNEAAQSFMAASFVIIAIGLKE